MSRYTTELRFMLETQAGFEEAGAASDVNQVIEDTRAWLFNFNYPSTELTTSEKEHLEKHIMLHYYTREIGFETFGLFKLKLQTKLWDIMPRFEKLYAVEHENLDFFSDVDWTEKNDGTFEQDGTANERTGSVEHANSGKQSTTMTGGAQNVRSGSQTAANSGTDTKTTNGKYKDTNGGSDIDLFSDTPQSEVDITASAAYITTANKSQKGSYTEREYTNLQEQDTDNRSTTTTFNNVTDTTTFNNQKSENENNQKLTDTFQNLLDTIDKTDTTHMTKHVFGNMGNNIDKLIKYRDNIINIEELIIFELNDLFIKLWI
mgnify:CR=1 FL=1